MFSNREADFLLFAALTTQRLPHRLPGFFYRMTEIMPATPADSRLTVNQVITQMKHEERANNVDELSASSYPL